MKLWVDGPRTPGMFRQGSSVRKLKDLRDAIDNSECV